MAISIDWGQKIINVPKADTLLVVAGPPQEIRQLDLNVFRLALKDLEDSEEGIWALDTHNHNPPVTVGGVTLARVVEIINGYTVTFEDGQYAVNLVGANSNVGDVVNVNQVSVRSANSAGLTFSELINDQSFINGYVYVDEDRGLPGTSFPRGTMTDPVNNLEDAKIIADGRRLHAFKLYGSFTLSESFVGYSFLGEDPSHDILDFNGYGIDKCSFTSLGIYGSYTGIPNFNKCHAHTLTSVAGTFSDCFIFTSLNIRAAVGFSPVLVSLDACKASGPVTVNVGGSQKIFACSGLSGAWTISGAATGMIPTIVQLGFMSGSVVLQADCTGGQCTIEGVVDVTDNSTMTVNRKAQLQASPGAYAGYVWIDTVNGRSGTLYPIGTPSDPVNNLADAVTIATAARIRAFKIKGTLPITQSIENYSFEGVGNILNDILVFTGTSISGSFFKLLSITGTQNGVGNFQECVLQDVSGAHGILDRGSVGGTITLAGLGSFFYCNDVVTTSATTIDMVGPGRVLRFRVSGDFTISNCQDGVPFPTSLYVGLGYGSITFDASCTGGVAEIKGDGVVTNNGAIVVVDSSLDGRHGDASWEGSGSAPDIAAAVWNADKDDYNLSDTMGELLNSTSTGGIDPASLAAAIWNANKDTYNSPDTMGELQNTGGESPVDPDSVAAAVWNALMTSYGVPGTMGWLQNLLNNTTISRPKILPGD